MAEHDAKTKGGRGRLAVLAVVVIVAVLAVAAYSTLNNGPSATPTNARTQFSIGADAVVSTAAGQEPAGYTLESSKGNPQASADWAVLGQADGSLANITALVFTSANDSQAYYGRLVPGLKGLPGYTDASSALSSYQQYGSCYGYGEDVDSIAVVNGVCTKGNVFLQVHLVSSKPFDQLEGDMTSMMGALYTSVA